MVPVDKLQRFQDTIFRQDQPVLANCTVRPTAALLLIDGTFVAAGSALGFADQEG
jgi:hypothetical protein